MNSRRYQHFSLPALLVISGQHRDPLVNELYRRMRDLANENKALKQASRSRNPASGMRRLAVA